MTHGRGAYVRVCLTIVGKVLLSLNNTARIDRALGQREAEMDTKSE